jgi:hypothetical protein
MQPWINKTSGSSSRGTLHFDKTLSYLNTHEDHQQYASSFRTKGKEPMIQQQEDGPSNLDMLSSFATYPCAFESNLAPYQDIADGLEVLEFLNSTSYSDYLHEDDLKPESMAFSSYRHQLDNQHALSEKEKLQMHWTSELLEAEDIVEYLMNTKYTEDIYGIPVLGQYIKEAQAEVTSDQYTAKAVERLSMIRSHLMSRSQGNVQAATKKVFEMNENDWSTFFS